MARTTSTQALVRGAALGGATDGYCVVASEQTAGHGRHGRAWYAPPGRALLVSVLLRIEARHLPGLPFAAGLSVVDALTSTTGLTAQLKWPNDVLADGSKLAGLLVETAGPPRFGRAAAVLGLGLNHTVDAFPPGVSAVSLHRLVTPVPPLPRLLDAWLAALGRRVADLEALGAASTIAAWRSHAAGLGDRVTAAGTGGVITGVATGVDDTGALFVRDGSGQVHSLLAADVTLSPRDATMLPELAKTEDA